jgi:ribokinase
MTQSSPGIVIVGSINADLITRVARWPGPGETILGESFQVLPGGKGANQAVAAALVAARDEAPLTVAMVGAVGDDAQAEVALRQLRAASVDLRAVQQTDLSTGIAAITVGPGGDNSIIVVPGANSLVTGDFVNAQRHLLAQAEVVVSQLEIPLDTVAAAAALAPGRFILNFSPIAQVGANLLRRADPLVVNEHEAAAARAILKVGSTREAEPLVMGEEADCVATLVDNGVRSVVLTLGARGCLVATSQGISAWPALAVRAVDTTGAGDAFVGALAARLAAGDSLAAAAQLATRVSAYSVQHPGAQPSYPTPADPLPG